MGKYEHAWEHLRTINHHKMLVMKGCFALGLYKQGLLHDLSKYCPTEFLVGARYYKGYMSPNNIERREKGYSASWLHHKGRNKHHMEYWIDYGIDTVGMTGMKMPICYVVEMYVDRVSASKNYEKEHYTDSSALDYYNRSYPHYIIHEDTAALLELLLEMLAIKGEKKTNAFIRSRLLKGRIPYEKAKLDEMKARLKG